MRKLTFFWRELHAIAPMTVERCACVWMINGARAQLRQVFTERIELDMQQAGVQADSVDPEEDSIAQNVEEIMALLDATHQYERRIVLSGLLGSGLLLTLQPWLSLNFFSLPLLLAGAMLLGLEFSPRTGVGFVGMARRLKKDFGSNKS